MTTNANRSRRPNPTPDWDPELRRVTLVLDLDVSVLAIPPDTWALTHLRNLSDRLNQIGITATPIRIKIDRRTWPA